MSFPEPQRFEAKLGKKPFLVTMEVNPPTRSGYAFRTRVSGST